MTMTLLTGLLTGLAAVASAVAAIISAAASRTSARSAKSQRELAERQHELQRRHQELEELRVKRELYERRLRVYQAVRILSDTFSVYKPPKNVATFDHQEVTAFSRDTAESDFLFGDEISSYLKEMGQKARRLALLTERLDPVTLLLIPRELSPNVDIDSYVREQNELQLWFNDQFKIVKEKFKPYLDISEPKEAKVS